jgi:Zn-dependent protease
MVIVPILCFFSFHGMMGWASAPYDPLWERRHPRRAGWMALAGPAANFTLMILAAIGLRVGASLQLFRFDPAFGATGPLGNILWVFFSLNLLLGTFNLLPVPPLDGSAGVLVLMSERQAQGYLDWIRGNNYVLAGLLIGLYVFQRIFPVIERTASQIFF